MTQADNLAALGSYVNTSGVLQQTGGGNQTTTGYYGFKNRIINGAMMIDQRNAGASVSVGGGAYTLDRWYYDPSATLSWYTFQQNGGSVTPPAGFTNYLGITSTGANSPTSGQFTLLAQYIEGFNTADLNWGTANAKTVTLSFWVRSSLTGTFGGALANSAFDRSYPFTYTISAANTWEQKSITVAGDTTGTWIGATNGLGLRVIFGLGVGSGSLGPAGSWAGATYRSATGATNVSATNGATFYITGVQLEVGSTATSFDTRSIGTELGLCQRYYEKSYNLTVVPGSASQDGGFGSTGVQGATTGNEVGSTAYFRVTKRANPTMTYYDGSGNINKCARWNAGVAITQNSSIADNFFNSNSAAVYSASGATATGMFFHATASAEL